MEKRRGSKAGASAPYGRACMSCYKSKCKCFPRADGGRCERCHRLDKECHPADSIRRRTIRKKEESDARIAILEGKLDGLLSILQSRQIVDDATAEQLWQPTPSHDPRSSRNDNGDAENDTDTSTGREPSPFFEGLGTERVTQHTTVVVSDLPTPGDYLDMFKFRTRMLPYFPFFHLPAHITTQELEHNRPFLLRAILCVASHSCSGEEKRKRGDELKKALLETIFLSQGQDKQSMRYGADRTMDFLLGLLTYIAWGWDNILPDNSSSLSHLIMVAMSLVGKMRLDKPAPMDADLLELLNKPPPGFEGLSTDPSENDTTMTKEDFLQRHRAVLGCFLLSSSISAYIGEIRALQWTSQMDEGLAAISANANESPSDGALALQVRLQLLVTKAVQARGGHRQLVETSESALYIKSLLEQLQELKVSATPGLQAQYERILQSQISFAEFSIIETLHAANAIVPPTMNPNTSRLMYLWKSVQTLNACTTDLLAISPSDFVGISFHQWAQLTRSIVALKHLHAFEDPSWDFAAMRTAGDVSVAALVVRVAEKLESAARELGDSEADGVFMQLASRIRGFERHAGGVVDGGQDDINGNGDNDGVAPTNRHYTNPRLWLEQIFMGTADP